LILSMPPPSSAGPSAPAAGPQPQGAVQGDASTSNEGEAEAAETRPPTLGTWGQDHEPQGLAPVGGDTSLTGGGIAVSEVPSVGGGVPSTDDDEGDERAPPATGSHAAPPLHISAEGTTAVTAPGQARSGSSNAAPNAAASTGGSTDGHRAVQGLPVLPADRHQVAQYLSQELAAMNAAIESAAAQAAALEAVTAAVATAAVLAAPTPGAQQQTQVRPQGGAQVSGMTRSGSSSRRRGTQRASTPPGQRPGNRARAAALQQQQQQQGSGSNSIRASAAAASTRTNPLSALLSGAGASWFTARGGGAGAGATQQTPAADDLLRSRSARMVTGGAAGGGGGNIGAGGGDGHQGDGSAAPSDNDARASGSAAE
jgi:hypothetical protein